MGKHSKLLGKILAGEADTNIEFTALCQLLRRFGFDERIRGGHHIFTRPDIGEIINLQPKGNKAKPYQVRQIRNIITIYHLGASDVDQV